MANGLNKEDNSKIEKVFENLPVVIHVGFPHERDNTVLGWSNAFRSKEDGTTTIVMTLDPEASEKLNELTEMFKLYTLGFTGVKRREAIREEI